MAMLAKDYQSEGKVLAEFTPPSSFAPSDKALNGGEDETMVSYRMKPDRTLCITKLGGIEADDGGEEIEMEETEEVSMPESMFRGGY